jgi:predicted secreted protein
MYAAAAMKMSSDSIESQNVEGGNTTLRVNANGSIQLH